MVMRRLLGLVATLSVVLFVGAAPALADDGHGHNGWHGKPTYPPSSPSIWITKTEVMVGGTAVVKASGCTPKSTATVTVYVGSSPSGTQAQKPRTVKTSGIGLVSTSIRFTTPTGPQTVVVACAGAVTQWVTVHVVARTGGNHGHDDATTSGYSPGSKGGSAAEHTLSLKRVASTSPLQRNAVPLALAAGVVLLLGTGSGLVFTSRRRHRHPRHAYTR